MAPTKKHTRKSILEGSFNFVREKGFEKISARRIANYINASTAPIYSNFKSMEELEQVLEEKAINTLKRIIIEIVAQKDYDLLDLPLRYIEFSLDEMHLFNQIAKSQNSINKMQANFRDNFYVTIMNEMKRDDRLEGLGDADLQEMFFRAWLYAHGIATFLDRDLPKEDNLKYARRLLEDSLYSSAYALRTNFKKEDLINGKF